jgi:DNA repair photolyase
MLGQLYKPKGLALETARAVLEVEDPYACNVAYGCSNACGYCYTPFVMRKKRSEQVTVRYPKVKPHLLVKEQFESGLVPEGVFISFMTDPFLKENRENTKYLIDLLSDNNFQVATLSKSGMYAESIGHSRIGMTIVSLDTSFWKQWEINSVHPTERVYMLNGAQAWGNYTWVSLEPYPPAAIYKQNLKELLEKIKFVDFIIFGKWNYDARARTLQAKQDYQENVATLRDFCKSNSIRYHVKTDTLKFIGALET